MNFSVIHRKAGVKLEQPRVTDQAALVELLRNVLNGIRLVYGNGHGLVLPSEGQYIRGADPCHSAKRHADDQHNCRPYQRYQNIGDTQQSLALLPAGSALPGWAAVGGHRLRFRFRVQKVPEFLIVQLLIVVGRCLLLPVQIRLRLREEIRRNILREFPLRFGRLRFRVVQLRVVQHAQVKGLFLLPRFRHAVEAVGILVPGNMVGQLGTDEFLRVLRRECILRLPSG